MDPKIEDYILDIIFSTRSPEKFNLNDLSNLINFGASPRGSINLAKASRVHAFIKRRGYVTPEDVRAVCYDVLRHRFGLTYEAEAENVNSEEIIDRTFLHRDWFMPIVLLIAGMLISRVSWFTMSYALFRLNS